MDLTGNYGGNSSSMSATQFVDKSGVSDADMDDRSRSSVNDAGTFHSKRSNDSYTGSRDDRVGSRYSYMSSVTYDRFDGKRML